VVACGKGAPAGGPTSHLRRLPLPLPPAPPIFLQISVPHLRKTRGNIINVSSLSGYFGQFGSSTYCATKGGLTGMTKSIAIDEAAHDVRANTVSPGNVWTPLWEEHVQGPTADADIQGGKDAQLLGRMGTIHEVGEVCLHLATAEYTTGHEYLMTGGAELGYARKTRKGAAGTFG
jgi:NAD(P)-dependent dehydrogenase (short-subunit alcohol dehydrogenase family)